MTLQDDNNIAKFLCDNKLEVGIIIDCALLCWISGLLATLGAIFHLASIIAVCYAAYAFSMLFP